MSKLTIVSPKDMIRIIEKLNFLEVRQNGSHKFLKENKKRIKENKKRIKRE